MTIAQRAGRRPASKRGSGDSVMKHASGGNSSQKRHRQHRERNIDSEASTAPAVGVQEDDIVMEDVALTHNSQQGRQEYVHNINSEPATTQTAAGMEGGFAMRDALVVPHSQEKHRQGSRHSIDSRSSITKTAGTEYEPMTEQISVEDNPSERDDPVVPESPIAQTENRQPRSVSEESVMGDNPRHGDSLKAPVVPNAHASERKHIELSEQTRVDNNEPCDSDRPRVSRAPVPRTAEEGYQDSSENTTFEDTTLDMGPGPDLSVAASSSRAAPGKANKESPVNSHQQSPSPRSARLRGTRVVLIPRDA